MEKRTILLIGSRKKELSTLETILFEAYIVECVSMKEFSAFSDKELEKYSATVTDTSLAVAQKDSTHNVLWERLLALNIPLVLAVGASVNSIDFELLASEFIFPPYEDDIVLARVKNAIIRCSMMNASSKHKSPRNMDILEYKATFDILTGLYNRATFEEKVRTDISEGGTNGAVFIMLDIDNFKLVNDTMGHLCGDEVLEKTGRILKTFCRGNMFISRPGGDEFALYIPHSMKKNELEEFLNIICAAERFHIGQIPITCSVGACMCTGKPPHYHTLYSHADSALLEAKRLGKNQYRIYGEQEQLPSHLLFRNMDWLLDESTDAIFVCDAQNYDLIYLNSVACRFAGKDKRNCIGKKCYETLWNTDGPCRFCISGLTLSDEFVEHEVQPRGSDKCYVIKEKLIDWGGRPARIQYLRDNTEKEKMLKQLSEMSAESKRLLDFLPGGLFTYYGNEKYEFDFISENMFKMLGYTREEFLEKFENSFVKMIYQADRDRVLSEIEKQISCNDFDQCDYRIEKKDGTLMWVHDEGHLVIDSDGRKCFYVTVVDTTKAHEIQERLEQSEALLSAAVEYGNLYCWEYDIVNDICRNGKRSSVSSGLPSFTKASPEGFISSGYIHRDSVKDLENMYEKLRNGAINADITIKAKSAADEMSVFRIHCMTIFDEYGKPCKALCTAKETNKEAF